MIIYINGVEYKIYKASFKRVSKNIFTLMFDNVDKLILLKGDHIKFINAEYNIVNVQILGETYICELEFESSVNL